MKQIFNSGNYSQKANLAFLILRVVIGSVMLTHVLEKLSMLFGSNPIQFPDPVCIGATASLAFTVFAEVVCSFLLIFGIATRFAATVLLINMAVAVLIIHAQDAFGVKELAVLYLLTYLIIAIVGAGKISIDNLIYKKISQ
jgi:putative oxidoreductase